MECIDTITLKTGRIELFSGDLSAIPTEHAVDVLVLSAYPNGYNPTSTSLIGALRRRGFSVRRASDDKEIDLRGNYSCWISKPLKSEFNALNFKRMLCFEPAVRGKAPTLVADVFQALSPFVCGPANVRSVAMPVLAAGDQGIPVSVMLPPMLDAAIQWMSHGLPLDTLKIVIKAGKDITEARSLFESAKRRARILVHQAEVNLAPRHDVFISYSRPDQACAESLKAGLENVGLTAFLDKAELQTGVVWQQKIFEAMDICRATAVLYSPDYLASKVCREEFTIGWTRQREGDAILFPLLVRETQLPPHMQILNYIDCRPSDATRVAAAAGALRDRLLELRR